MDFYKPRTLRGLLNRVNPPPPTADDAMARNYRGLHGLLEWIDNGPYALQRPETPAWHKLRDNLAADDGIMYRKQNQRFVEEFCEEDPQVFLIQHDWAEAFGAADLAGDYKLPYDRCCFEFAINGRRCCVMARQIAGAQPMFMTWTEIPDNWVGIDPSEDGKDGSLAALMARNIRAVCVALDTEVAYTEVVRAPLKLNIARAKRGKTPLPDYRVVKLPNKARTLPAGSEPSGRRVRLHFRRGHWRHFETHKTWIRWTLVGDPDMAFVDKYYRL